jgi:RecA-family ATPase
MFGIALSFRIAEGAGFLHWCAGRPVRVLYVDGEMATRLVKQRLADEEKRHGGRPANLYVLSHHDIEDFSPLNTAKGQAQLEAVITRIGGVDLIIFDNIMSLIGGDMTSEPSWAQIVPWTKKLTGRRIGQL